jgi:hypothetical protein
MSLQKIDGGYVATPDLAFYNLDGAWHIESHGVAPDYEVEMDPKLVREGHGPQLEKAVEVAMEQLRESPVNYGKRPSYPNYQKFPRSHFKTAWATSGWPTIHPERPLAGASAAGDRRADGRKRLEQGAQSSKLSSTSS